MTLATGTLRRTLSSILVLSLCGVSSMALAQEQAAPVEEDGLESITVTARKTTENLQDTPISITAFSASRLEAQGITGISRIQDFTPNLTFTNIPSNSGVASNAAVYIRGIGQSDFAPTVEPGVGIYIDGVYLGRSVGGVFDLVDVESVEVLRGPQGTLFGRNTIGGAVNVTTMRPSEVLRIKGDIKYGTDNLFNVRGLISGPLTEGLYAKVSGSISSQDGYVRAVNLNKDLGNKDSKTVRGALRYAPDGSGFEVTLAGDYTWDKSNGPPTVVTGINEAEAASFVTLQNAVFSGLGNPALCYTPAQLNNPGCYNQKLFSRDKNYSTATTFSDLELWSASLTASYDIAADTQIKSITALRRINGSFGQDRDGSPLPISSVFDTFTQKQFTQELQIVGKALDSRLSYLAGLFYFTEKGQDINPIAFLPVTAQSGGLYDYKNWAAFAQLSYEVTPGLKVTGGLRYTDDDKKYLPDQYVTGGITGIPNGTRIVPFEWVQAKVKKWTPMANISYEVNRDLMIYATYSEGFKGGGYTQRIFPPEPSLPSFRPESVVSYEAGFKAMALDNRLRFNAAAFYTDYRDMQLLVSDGSRVGPFISNAGKARIQGFEAEMNLAPAEGWRFNAAVGLTDAKFKDLAGGVQGLTLASKFVLISKWTISASGEKEIDLADAGSLTPHVDWSYRSGFFTNASGINTPELYQPGYSVFNANLRWQNAAENYSLTIGVDNIGDNKFRTFGDYQPSFGFRLEAFDRGRQYYIRAGVSF